MATRNFAEAVQGWESYADELANYPGVISVSTGYRVRGGKETREAVVVVSVERKLPPEELRPDAICPGELLISGGTQVGVDIVEDLGGYPELLQDVARYDPIPGGVSMGRVTSQSAGTLGGWFCTPDDDAGGFDVVWLTNTHVVSGTLNTIPGDSRVVQPSRLDDNTNWGLNVFGRTTQISPFNTSPFNPVNPASSPPPIAALDAAIGTANDDVDLDYRVLNIAPAPFELDQVTGGMTVQKRGRTTRRTTGGTVLGATTNPWTTVNVTYLNRTRWARFGTPGTTPVFRVRSARTGQANSFSLGGDSGSLIFDTARGNLASTFPCVGLLFAGNGNGIAAGVRSTTWAFDIGSVAAQLQLETVCTCVIRAILAAIFGRNDRARGASTSFEVKRADRMMRRFRDKVLSGSRVGQVITEAVAQTAPDVSRVLAQDEISFGLAVELLTPWARAATSLSVLAREIDEQTVSLATELGERVIRLCPETTDRVAPLIELIHEYEGQPVRKLVGPLRTRRLPKTEQEKSSAQD